MSPRSRGLAAAAVALLACTDSSAPPTAPVPDLAVADAAAGRVSVLSRNLYIGANADALIEAFLSPDPSDDLPALVQTAEVFLATDFPSRAAAIADEIARNQPMVVGLQEVERVEVDLTLLGLPYLFTVDFEPVLYAALAARGLAYVKAAENTNIDLDLLPGPPTVALRDKDVVLVRADLAVAASGNKSYDICLHPVPGACPITVPFPFPIGRGYAWARIVLDDVPWTFVTTHLESGGDPFAEIRAVEVQELLATFAASPGPVVMLGDFNDRPEADGLPIPDAYELITGPGGFTDVWRSLRPGVAGLTCCHAPDLSNPLSVLSSRIDYVFARGVPGKDRLQGAIGLVGVLPSERISFEVPLWPSDHAGLAAEFLLPPGQRGP